MNIQTAANNLRNTIAGKERMLAQYQSALACSYTGPTPPAGAEMACIAIIQFLEINIAELKSILQDVDQCRPWVGLTLERKMDMAESYFTDEWAINRAIQLLSGCENALKEKNT